MKEDKVTATADVRVRPRFSGNDLAYYVNLLALFVGLGWHYSLDVALIVLGTLGVMVSLINAYLQVAFALRRPKGK